MSENLGKDIESDPVEFPNPRGWTSRTRTRRTSLSYCRGRVRVRPLASKGGAKVSGHFAALVLWLHRYDVRRRERQPDLKHVPLSVPIPSHNT